MALKIILPKGLVFYEKIGIAMDPEIFKSWFRVLRDAALASTGIFILIHETLSDNPQELKFAAGFAALGLAPALRLDERRRSDSNEDKDA